jgi:hypothetical protein
MDDAGGVLADALDRLSAIGEELGGPQLDLDALRGLLEAGTGLDVEEDLLGWLGGASLFVIGTGEKDIEIGTVLQTSDQAASAGAINAIGGLLEGEFGGGLVEPRLEGADAGFSALPQGGEGGFEVAQLDDRVVGAAGWTAGAGEAADPSQALSASEAYGGAEEALGDQAAPLLYVALQELFTVAERGGQSSDPGYLAARPYLDALEYLIVGTSDDGSRARFVVGVSK